MVAVVVVKLKIFGNAEEETKLIQTIVGIQGLLQQVQK